MTTLVRGRWLVTGDAVLDDAAVAVDGNMIVETGAYPALMRKYPNATVLGTEDTAVLPGFVNAHHHSHGMSTIQNGHPDLLLESWILGFAGLRQGHTHLDTLLSSARQLRSGVTTVVDVHSGGGTADDYEQSVEQGLSAYDIAGMRAAFATGTSTQSRLVHGKGEDERFLAQLPERLRERAADLLPRSDRVSGDEYLDIVEAKFKEFESHPLIDVWYAPPGPQWVSDELMCQIAERAQHLDTQIQTHCNESFYEKLQADRFYGRPTMEHLEALGVLSSKFSIAHGVWLCESEIEAMQRTGAALSHNPSSNLRLRAGIAPLNALLAADVCVGLGMDGTTLNEDEDMFSEVRLALRLNRVPRYGFSVPSTLDAAQMATAGGARLMGKETEIGCLATGFKADLFILNLERLTYPWVAPEADPLEVIYSRARQEDIELVMVDGEVVMEHGRSTRFDEAEAAAELAGHLAAQPFPEERARLAADLTGHMEAWYQRWEVPDSKPYTEYNGR